MINLNLMTLGLWVNLSYRLQKHSDVCVLMALMLEHADISENKTSAEKISLISLQEMVTKKQVQRSLNRLSESGLIEIRIHANTRTHIKVNREAVLALLRTPLPPRLPGLNDKNFPFLEAWHDSMTGSVAASNVETDIAGSGSNLNEDLLVASN